VAGAATAWLIRVTIDTTLLMAANRKLLGLSMLDAFSGRGGAMAAAAAGLILLLAISRYFTPRSMAASGALVVVALLVFSAMAWWRVLEAGERAALAKVIKRRRD
jgi:hypothetical protein